MFKLMRKNRKGFTLIELIVVIAILAILAAIAIPTFSGITDNANKEVLAANARSIATAVNAYNALNPNAMITTLDATSIGTLTTENLWPTGLPASGTADYTATLDRVDISAEGVAVATEASGT